MKKQTYIIALSLLIFGCLFVSSPKAYADPPKCFLNNGTNSGTSGEGIDYQQKDCTSTTDSNGAALVNDKCYEINTNFTPVPIDCLKIMLHIAAFQKNGGETDASQVSSSALPLEGYSNLESSPIYKKYLKPAVQVFSTGVLLLIIAAISFSGIQYAASRDDPQMVADAKKRITYSLVALVMYVFFFALLQWLIPGGIFSV